jgi:hypothetical protein
VPMKTRMSEEFGLFHNRNHLARFVNRFSGL